MAEEHVYELLEKLRIDRKLTVLLVSHDLSVVYQRATKVLCISKGKRCFGAPRDILTPEILAEVYSAPVKFYGHLHDHHEPDHA